MRFFFSCLCMGIFSTACSQPSIADSIARSFGKKPALSVRLDMRNAFITNQLVHIGGAKLGLSFGRKINVGLSWNWMRSMVFRVPPETGTPEKLSIQYGAGYFEYAFYQKNRWSLSMTASPGFGYWRYKPLAVSRPTSARAVAVFEATESIGYDILYWLSADVGIGYRLFPLMQQYPGAPLHSPIYALHLKLKTSKLIGHVVHKSHPLMGSIQISKNCTFE